MRQFSAMQSALTCRFTFGNILPGLPVPGTPAFAQLCRELKKFGFSAEKFSFETPTAKLSDVRVTISILEDAVTLRVQYEWLELAVSTLLQEQENSLVDIINTTLQALALLDLDVWKGKLAVQHIAHLRLDSQDPDAYVGEHLMGGDASYRPDAFAFNLVSGGDVILKHGRIVIAVSAIFPGSVFVDYVAEYPNPKFTPDMVNAIRVDYNERLALLGLTENKGEEKK
ncbi:MAG: hypothetical protein ABIZ80_17990 [Bryobacteraceae bacterium]